MKDARDLISKWDTVAKFAEAAGQPYERASQWHKRNCIASEHFPAVIKAAEDHGIDGVTFEFLHKIRNAELRRRRPKVEAA
jgi:hypothetical protein